MCVCVCVCQTEKRVPDEWQVRQAKIASAIKCVCVCVCVCCCLFVVHGVPFHTLPFRPLIESCSKDHVTMHPNVEAPL